MTNGSRLVSLLLLLPVLLLDVVLLHRFPLSLSSDARFLPLTHSASVIFCMSIMVDAKNDFPTRSTLAVSSSLPLVRRFVLARTMAASLVPIVYAIILSRSLARSLSLSCRRITIR